MRLSRHEVYAILFVDLADRLNINRYLDSRLRCRYLDRDFTECKFFMSLMKFLKLKVVEGFVK